MSEPPVIPIQNLYYLLCYAWDRLDQSRVVDVSAIDCPTPVDLFASLLIKGTEHLRRRGLNVGYQSQDAEIAGIRGKIDILNTERRLLLQHARAACTFDELTVDTLPNRILKSTLHLLASDPDLDRLHRSGIQRVLRTLATVSDVPINSRSFRMIQLDRNSSFYRFLLNICELVHSVRVPEEETGRYRFRDFLRDDKKMAFLFQYFVYNFLRFERRDLDVRRENIPWKIDSLSYGTRSLLPQMQTDISIRTSARKIIIDTKYYRKTLSEHYGAERFRSEHLYQLLCYLCNIRELGQAVEGILLYPLVDRELKEQYSILGMTIRVETLNLAQPWDSVRKALSQLVTN